MRLSKERVILIRLFCALFKITGWLPQRVAFRTKVYYEDKSVQSRRIKGKAVIVSNHTSLFDYIALVFTFLFRTLRVQMAEVLYEKKFLGFLLKMLGGIYVNRNTLNLSFISKSEDVLNKGGVVGIFPESRLPLKGEERPLPFKSSAAFIALSADAPVIPVYIDGRYFTRKRTRIIIGKPMNINDYIDDSLPKKENLINATNAMRDKIIELERMMNEKRTNE